MNKIIEDLIKVRKVQKGILLGFAVVGVALASVLSFYYFTVITH